MGQVGAGQASTGVAAPGGCGEAAWFQGEVRGVGRELKAEGLTRELEKTDRGLRGVSG